MFVKSFANPRDTALQPNSDTKHHDFSKHVVFLGHAFKLGRIVGDMANGGQILLTGEGLEQLRGNFKDAGFPRIEHLGQYSLSAMNEVVDLYEVGPGIVSTLPRRTFLKGYKGATMIGDKTNGLLIHTDLDAIKGRAAIISMKTRGSISAGVLK